MKRRNRCAIIPCLFAVLLALVFLPISVLAAELGANTISIKVAYFSMNGYYEKDVAGDYTGYGIEYLNAVEQCSNITFEYVDAETWQNAIEMLRSGEVDILAPAQITSDRDAEFDFLTYPISYEYGGLLTLESRDDLSYENFDSFFSLTLGCTRGQVFEDDYELYAADNGFAAKEIKYYDTWPELYDALENGEVDAVITNMMYAVTPLKIIARFGINAAYIMIKPDRADIVSVLENAVNRINVESPNFLTQLADKYYPQYKSIPFTQKELAYIASAPAIRVLCNINESPFSHMSNDKFHGISISLLDKISQMSGLEFDYVPVTTRADMLAALQDGTGDMIASDAYDFTWARQENVYQLAPYMSAQFVSIVSEPNHVAAMVPGRFSTDYLQKYYPDIKILPCDSVADCVSAVQSGKAGFTIINSYEANDILSSYPKLIDREESLYIIQQVCMSLSKTTAPELRSVIGKCLGQISEAEIYECVNANTNIHQNITLSNLIVKYPAEMLTITVLIVLFLGGCIYIMSVNRVKTKNNRELKLAAEKANQASQAKSDFLSSMSHDIRTPMNAIVNLTSLAIKDIHDEARLLSDLDKIKLSSDFLLGLINDILDMSRIENGQFKLEPKVYTSKRFENYLQSVMAPLFSAKNIRFEIDKSEVVPALYVDEVRFNQIFFNVLSNAAKYTPNGGTVTFSTNILTKDATHLHAEFIIKDTGIGMSEEFINKAFEPFEREKAVEAYTGTGLGLAITKAIVDAFGGTIDLKSVLGKGTTVTITLDLPVPDDKLISESLQHEKMEGIHELGFGTGGTVLVAEDHPLNQEIITRLLKKQCFLVDCVENGALAVERVENTDEDTYQFILMDVRMPVMDGLTATKQIRALKNKRKASIPIIAMTADAFTEDRNRCLDAGMNEYLSKPVNVAELMAAIKKMLAGQSVRRPNRVLVVDDVEVNIAIIKAALESDFEVLTAESGSEALECLAQTKGIVAVITDIQMPGMNGSELIERIRAESRYDHISVLANTQYGDPQQEERLLVSGADDFVYKPTTPGIVVTRLYNSLKRKQQE